MSYRFEWGVLSISMVALLLLLAADFRELADKRSVATMAGTFDDSALTNQVRSALLADPDLKLLGFKVNTRKGKVQLTGLVETEAQIDRAIVLVRSVSGVKGVSIKVVPRSPVVTLGSKTKIHGVTTTAKTDQLAEDIAVQRDVPLVVSSEADARPGGFVDDQMTQSHVTEIVFGTDAMQSASSETTINK